MVDLLKRSAVKEHANLYVTSLIDLLYKPEQLLALETNNIRLDERYLLIKGKKLSLILYGKLISTLEAVKNKFRVDHEELETMWEWLHVVFLAKRRTIRGKKGTMS